MPLIGRLSGKFAILIPFACEDYVFGKGEALELAVHLVDIAVPLVIFAADGDVAIIQEILDVPIYISLEDCHRVISMSFRISVIGGLVHEIPVIADAVVRRCHGYVHDVIGLSHIYSESDRSLIRRERRSLGRIHISRALSLRSYSIYIYDIVRAWIQSLVLQILIRTLVDDGPEVFRNRDALVLSLQREV